MTTAAKKKKAASSSLVGLFFHSVEEDGKTIKWQGYVKKHIGGPKDLYLLQLFEWLMGFESTQELVPSEKMAGWRFYNCTEDMVHYYEEYSRREK